VETIGTPFCLFIGVASLQWWAGAISGVQQWWKREEQTLLAQARRCRLVGPKCKGEWAVHRDPFHFAWAPKFIETALSLVR
jgi:hypothetical protein